MIGSEALLRPLGKLTRMAGHMDRPNIGLALYGGLLGFGAAAFAIWMCGLLEPTKAQNPGLAAYKAPPATVIDYAPANRSPREAVRAVEPAPEPAAETIGSGAPQHQAEVSDLPPQPTKTKEAARPAAPKRQTVVRRSEPRQRNGQFAVQPFFGLFRP
jgi:hypothetical protein